MNTDFIVKGDNKTAEELGFNTDLDKAQVITKDEDKVLDAELHTDLLNKSERDKIADLGINLSEIIQSMVNHDSGGVLNTYKAHKYGRLLEAHMDKDPRYKEILGDPNISAEDKQRVLNAAVNTFLTSRGYAGPPLEVLIGEESLLARGKVVISKDKLNGLSFLEDLGHELGHLVSYDDGNEDTAKIVEGKMGTLEETDTQGKYNNYLESLKQEYKNLKTEEETKEWLATVSESEIEYINGKRVLAGGAAVLISGGRIYVGVTTASAGVVLLDTPFFAAGGVLTLGGVGETIFGLSDFSVGVQDIYYGMIESEKESYNYLENKIDNSIGEDMYGLLNHVSGGSTSYTNLVKATYYDNNILLKYKDIGNGYLLTKTENGQEKVIGPKGGEYNAVGFDREGRTIFKNNKEHYIFKGGEKIKVTAPSLGGEIDTGLKRPYLTVATKKEIMERYTDNGDGTFTHNKTDKIIQGPTDYAHNSGFENRRLILAAESLGMDQKTFNKYVNSRNSIFSLENYIRNRSHKDEMPGISLEKNILEDMQKFLKELDKWQKKE